MLRVIIVANQKGGVGKTTTALNLAAALVKLGKRTMVIDMDPQGALTVSVGLDPYTIRPSTHDLLLSKKVTLAHVVQKLDSGLIVAPANVELAAAEYRLLSISGRVTRLKQAIEQFKYDIDYVVIDTPPSLGMLTVNAIVAGTELLIPVATDYLAMRGVRALLDTVLVVRDKFNPDLNLLGLVATQYKENSNHSDAVVAEMRKVFKQKVMQTIIPMDEAATAAPAARKTVLDYQPDSSAAQAYLRLAEEIAHAK
jgi:chromosome partitioning protein